MLSPNPHTALYSLLVLESVVKNCGAPIHDEISTKENCEMFTALIEGTPHENVKMKMLELIQAWAFAFRSSDKYQAIKVGLVNFLFSFFFFIKISYSALFINHLEIRNLMIDPLLCMYSKYDECKD